MPKKFDMKKLLEGKVALVTGGGTGIGPHAVTDVIVIVC